MNSCRISSCVSLPSVFLSLLLFIYYALPKIGIYFEPYGAALLSFIICPSTYQSEYVRGAILSIRMGQIQAAKALGFTPLQTIFSIIIPTWNNLPYLKICIGSILKNSAYQHQIIVHVNEGTDGTLEWVKNEGLDYTYSEKNIGVCMACNMMRTLVKTDYIFYGIMKELGWEEYVTGETTKPLTYVIPPVTATELAETLMEKFDLTGARIVGDPDAVVSKVFFCEHINGSPMSGDEKKIVKAADYDVIIPLEIVDWTLSEYVRDSCQLGRPRVLLEMGHFNFEELGMRYMTEWIPEIVGPDVPVHYIQSGDGFQYLT